MNTRHFWGLIALCVLLMSFAFSAQGQRREHLTNEEIELVRDVQDVDLRMAVFTKAIERRLWSLSSPDALSPEQKKRVEKDLDKWGELPKGTRAELFSDIDKILNEAVDKIEDVFEREPESELIPYAFYNLADYSKELIPILSEFSKNTEEKNELGLLNSAVKKCESILGSRREDSPANQEIKTKTAASIMSREIPKYLQAEGAAEYAEARVGIDGALLISELRSFVESGKRVLEIGMGPGIDLLLLAEHYEVTGSDYSRHFTERFKISHPEFNVLNLNAEYIETDLRFDCIFSNKVLHHLSFEALAGSMEAQKRVLNPGGVLFHSFWHGDEVCRQDGIVFAKYRVESIRDLMSNYGTVLKTARYGELIPGDSFFVVLKCD